jgi:hypothetical protein
MLWPLYPGREVPIPIVQEAGWVSGPVCMGEENIKIYYSFLVQTSKLTADRKMLFYTFAKCKIVVGIRKHELLVVALKLFTSKENPI